MSHLNKVAVGQPTYLQEKDNCFHCFDHRLGKRIKLISMVKANILFLHLNLNQVTIYFVNLSTKVSDLVFCGSWLHIVGLNAVKLVSS